MTESRPADIAEAKRLAGLFNTECANLDDTYAAAKLMIRLTERVQELEANCVNLEAFRVAVTEAARKPLLDCISKLEKEAQPRLTVRLTSFPESNGKRNWTAMLVRTDPEWRSLIGNCGGITIDRGEFWNRVAYEAECARFLIGERDTEPFILDYGDDIQTPAEWKGETSVQERRDRRASQSKETSQ